MAEELREDNIICPYCKSEWHDSWEFKEESDEDFECDECGKKFMWTRNVDVDYTSTPSCELNNEKCEFPEYGDVIKKNRDEGYFRCRTCNKCGEFNSINTNEEGEHLKGQNNG